MFVGIGTAGILLVRSQLKKDEHPVADKESSNGGAPRDDGAKTTPAGGIVAIPSLTPTVTQVVFAGGGDGFAAIVSHKMDGVGSVMDVVKTATGKPVGRVRTDTVSDTGYALSPKGNVFAVLGLKPFEGAPVSLFNVENGQLLKQFTPYPKAPGTVLGPDAVWIAITSTDQLLTINSEGGFDLWTLPEMKRTTGVAGRLKGGHRTDVNGFTHCPKNFSLSVDGKSLAIFNGSGFSFYNMETTTEICRTKDLMRPGNQILFSAAALSPDGSRFACYYQTFGAGAATTLSVWDPKTGTPLSSPLVSGNAPAGFAWWGSSHLLYWEGGISSASLFGAETGQSVGSVRTSIPGKFGTVPPNGQLWGVVGPHNYDPAKGTAFLVRADVPSAIRPGTSFELTQDGLKTK
ncbi:hypothetical protein FTUN_0994 [Frigoriglobus tundricola]|uniref:Uncharacterized protein n=1 Tax=Frigoriglobus tundricola TaxID=2774151 RepID=A0A6M5YHP3_9BACT|nr:hypothetical protein FTUN_0994 [Frigoriglobus tundricola]